MDIYIEVIISVCNELNAIDPDVSRYELLSPPRRAVLLFRSIFLEVHNGSFDQYFFNTSGDGATFTPDSLRLLGLAEMAAVVERANAYFPGGPSRDRTTRQRQMLALEARDPDIWTPITNDFCDSPLPYEGPIGGVTIPFILANSSEFFLPR